jgi:hypothetical protein
VDGKLGSGRCLNSDENAQRANGRFDSQLERIEKVTLYRLEYQTGMLKGSEFAMVKNIAFAMIAVVCTCTAQSDCNSSKASILWSPPNIGMPDRFPRPTIPKVMIGSLNVAGIPITLENTKLEEVQKRLGGTIGDRGDGGDSLAWLCFHGTNEDGRWILWLTSDEMGGLSYINGFFWSQLASNEMPDRSCRTLPIENAVIELPVSIKLGIAQEEMAKVLGQPTFEHRNILFFFHEHPKHIRKEPYTVLNTVAIALRDDHVSAIEVYKSTHS